MDSCRRKLSVYSVMILLLTGLISGCGEQDKLLVPGVSLELAKHRKERISNVQYQLRFDIPSTKSEPIPGENRLIFDLKENDSDLFIDFNVAEPIVESVTVNGESIEVSLESEKIIVPREFLSTGKNVVEISFEAGSKSLNRNDEYLYTLFVPDRACTAFPLFDQPDIKASYQLTLALPEEWKAIANGPVESVTEKDDKIAYSYAPTRPISSYLFAFTAGKFSEVSRQIGGRNLTMLHRETDSLKVQNNLDEIFELHAKSLAWLEEYTGIEYPFEKFGFALVPSFQYGGMEHPGTITYKAESLFLDENATQNRLLGRASLIAHETAHMWFGDLVTMEWFNDVWMKEVFANFMAAKIVHPSFPEINHDLRFLLAHYPSAYAIDRSQGSHPIQQPLDNLKNAGTLYGSIIYQKAPIVMRMLERRIGVDNMREGLRKYLSEYAYSNATWDDLINILDDFSDDNLEIWSDAWVKRKGRPYISVWLRTDEDSIVTQFNLTQRDFYDEKTNWRQQLRVMTMKDDSINRFDVDFSGQFMEIDSAEGIMAPNFILLNAGGYGYGNFRMGPQTTARLLTRMDEFDDPILRGVGWINLYENMLGGQFEAGRLLASIVNQLPKEKNVLLRQRMISYLTSVYWKFTFPDQRDSVASEVEQMLWNELTSTSDSRQKKMFFNAYQNVVLTQPGLARLKSIWSEELAVDGLSLSEADYTSLAASLAIKQPSISERVLQDQLVRISNSDRKARFEFLLPALSSDEVTRDAFFESLKDVNNREKESWVQEAVGYLHHPLRVATAVKYIRPSLEMLEEIQLTGDIFFPKRFLDNTFWGHQSPQAVDEVRQFLYRNNHYPQNLKNKILQASDLTFRVVDLNKETND